VLASQPPIIVHHMAALDGAFPPNSLEAVTACLEARAAVIEVDITALATDDYLLVHEPRLDVETTGRGAVGTLPADLAADLRIRWRATSTDYRVPLLSQVVDRCLDFPGGSRLQLDFKDVLPFASQEPLDRLVRLIAPLGERVTVSSEADWQLRQLRARAPWLDVGLDIHFYLDWRENRPAPEVDGYPRQRGFYGYWDDHPLATWGRWSAADYLSDRSATLCGLVPGASTFYVNHRFLVQSLADGFSWADTLHSRGIKLDAWTVDATNSEAVANARRLFADGVDQFTTNTPGALANLL
jgi:glycerophosphoryl diester phosphodiesterase